jgi:uncharacterized membrane protein (DUF373 family)
MTEHGTAQTQRTYIDWRLPRSVEAAQRLGMGVLAAVLIFLVLIALGWAVWSVGAELLASIGQPSFERFKAVTTEILAIFIFMEIFTLLMEYVRSQRLRLTNLVDATLAVILRELWVRLYGGHVEAEALVSIAVVLAALAVLRVVSVRFSVEGARPVA